MAVLSIPNLATSRFERLGELLGAWRVTAAEDADLPIDATFSAPRSWDVLGIGGVSVADLALMGGVRWKQWPFRSFMPLCNPFDFWELGFYNLAGPSHVSDLAIGVDGGAGPKRRVTVGARFVRTLLDFHAVLLKIMRSMWCNYVQLCYSFSVPPDFFCCSLNLQHILGSFRFYLSTPIACVCSSSIISLSTCLFRIRRQRPGIF